MFENTFFRMKMNDILLKWYEENKRELPWRGERDPYKIWVSEIMLQQTRVEAVKPYYHRFIEALPTIYDLSKCEEDVLYKLWEGLGYYSRVRNMKKAAIVCMEKYGGKLPSTYEELLTLAGIGPYSASAIASIAFKENKIAMDGNVLRVFSRLLMIEEDIQSNSAKQKIEDYFKRHPSERMGDMNQALMDFASAICLPKQMARCNICPLSSYCEAYKQNKVFLLPVKKEKKARRKEKYTVLMYLHKDRIFLRKRKAEGLLAGLYEFVMVEGHKAKKDFKKAIYVGKYTHIFSHIEWDMKGFILLDEYEEEGIWANIEEMKEKYSIPGAFSYYKERVEEYIKAHSKS